MTTSIALTACPKCGKQKLAKSLICSNCYAANSNNKRRGHRYDTCPNCNQDKDVRAKLCRRCRGIRSTKHPNPRNYEPSPNPELVTQDWLLEFRGFFLGEGTATIYCTNTKNKTTAQVSLSISQRADNIAYMQEIQTRLGGKIYITSEGRNPISRWHLRGLDNCLTVLELLYSPANTHLKMQDIAICIEFIKWRQSVPFKLSEENRAIAINYVEHLRSIRDFKVEGQSSLSLAL